MVVGTELTVQSTVAPIAPPEYSNIISSIAAPSQITWDEFEAGTRISSLLIVITPLTDVVQPPELPDAVTV